MKSILQSIKPQYCELIASGKKTIEVRKTRPKLDVPFKVYIYCTKDKLLTKSHNNGNIYLSENKYKSALEKAGNVTLSGKVIGEYVCNDIDQIVHAGTTNQNIDLCFCENGWNYTPLIAEFYRKSCLTHSELEEYSKGGDIYAWHISDLKIYDKPKELSEFYKLCESEDCDNCELYGVPYEGLDDAICSTNHKLYLIRPPQSWCYVEEVGA